MNTVQSASNVLDYMDESFFLDFRAQGHGPMIQFVWIYDHDVDYEGLRRFHQSLGKGLLGRCVEDSPLPGGRSRWVRWSPPDDFEIAGRGRPRSDIPEWIDEQSAILIDIESGPPWRLAVQPLLEGGAAVTLVVGHGVADGVGMSDAVADAVNGTGVDFGYPPANSRTRPQALFRDLRQFFRDVPQMAKAFMLAPRAAKQLPLRPRPGLGRQIVYREKGSKAVTVRSSEALGLARLPALAVLIPTEHWDQVAESLGGTSNSLLIGLTLKLCDNLGWLDSQGLANVTIPINERIPGDTRGNALTGAAMVFDPAKATDLKGIRATVRSKLSELDDMRRFVLGPLPLTPLVPKMIANRFQDVLFKSSNITCSHAGDLDPATNRPDGTDAERFFARQARAPELFSRALLKRVGGVFFPIASGRLAGHVYISICYSDADASMTRERLRDVVSDALGTFDLTAEMI